MNAYYLSDVSKERARFKAFINDHVKPKLSSWYRMGTISRSLFEALGSGDWYGFKIENGEMRSRTSCRDVMVAEELARISPGLAVTVLAHVDLGLMGLYLFGSDLLKRKYAEPALKGKKLLCLGNTEKDAGSDVANISMKAEKANGGWILNGTKAYVTNGFISDVAVITAVSDSTAPRNNRLSMFLVNLNTKGVTRKKLNKQVWIPSDLTRIQLNNAFVPDDHLLGEQGRGLQQVLSIFTHSRIPISAMTLGTAAGAFELAVEHARQRSIFNRKVIEFQSKAFELADLYSRMAAARLMVQKACEIKEKGEDFRLEASMAKYLSVGIARDVSTWAADLFGAASVILEHPIHKYPMDAWASSLGEGTQDVQKLVIFRELMKNM